MEAAQREVDREELERLFPTYETDSWDIRETRAKETLEELFETWEFATGNLLHQEPERFLSAIGPPPSDWDWRSRCHLHTLRLKMDQKDVCSHYNFYQDPNPGEVRLLYAPLTELMVRVAELRKQYEEAPVLGEILMVGAKTLNLPVFRTPVMQALTCTDHLLCKCQEWEDYASTSVSLRPLLQPLYALIKHWRQLETLTWRSLLPQQERSYILKDLPLWTSFVIAVEDFCAERNLYEVLEEFVRGATMALFPHRLAMLRAYFRKSPVFQHIYAYFDQFRKEFEAVRVQLAGDVTEEITEAVKLTKYDMSNHHALKDSIVRQQKHLHKLVRGYSLALESRFQECVLVKVRERYAQNVLEVSVSVEEEKEDWQSDGKASDIEDLCGEIFDRLDRLKANIGESTLRHKALKDLFAALGDLGISPIIDQREDSAFYSQPVISSVPEAISALFSLSESYYYRSLDRLSVLKQTSDVSKDLSTGEREKCLGLGIALMLETMKARRSVIEKVEEEIGWEWVRKVQAKVDSRHFEALQKYLIGDVSVRPEKVVLRSMSDADQYVSENPHLDLSSTRPVPRSSLITDIPRCASLYKSTAKLTFILTSLFLSLYHNGFCRPQSAPNPEDSGQTSVCEGTGMDEGSGDKNATKELEDQQQLESLRDKPDQPDEDASQNDMKEDAMDMEADFEGEEGSAGEDEDGEDEKGSAEGNERLLEDVQDVEMKEAEDQEVRDTANPEKTSEAPGERLNEQPKKSDIEEFDMQGVEQEGEVNSEVEPDDEDKSEPEPLDVDKLSVSGSEHTEENQESEAELAPDPPELQQHPNEDNKGDEESKSEVGEDDEVQQDPRYRNREFQNYENEAFGVKDRPANTKNLRNKDDGGQTEEEKVQGSDIISRLKREWKGTKTQGEKSADQTRQESQQGKEDVSPEDLVEDEDAEANQDPTSSSAFKYDSQAAPLAAAPSTTQQSDIHPSELTHKRDLPTEPVNPAQGESALPPDAETARKQREKERVQEGEMMEVEYPRPAGEGHFSDEYAKPVTKVGRPIEKENGEGEEMEVEETEIADSDPVRGKELWDHYQRLTQSAAQDLCEQLRIVLEATKANGLQGDYKTGKRINMKKVIGYIASRYRKDKIWLRRTKNTSREYQVLLAIDDSFSMAEHDLGTSALKGLCVLVQALRSLEVGELAVAQIREGMSLVHDFKDPLTQEKAESLMSQFRFDFGRKQSSDSSYPRFLQQCLAYLSAAGRSELQLVILISDGRLNKKQIRPYLLKAQNILFLCIILDNPSSSILAMKSTSFTNTGAGPQVEFRPYLEDFPFAHYIVLENPNMLVESMCDVVRQWFDFVKEM